MHKSIEKIWAQKYRPKTVKDTILPDRIKKIFQGYVNSGHIPNLLLSGTAGVGKTSIALAMCEELGINYMLIPASSRRGIDTLRMEVSTYAASMSFDGRPKVIILDEADGLTPDAQDALKGVIEEYSINCTFILTCNHKAKIIEPIHSRTSNIEFKLQSKEKPDVAKNFFLRLEEILKTENVVYDRSVLVKLVERYFPDFRRTLNEIQSLSKMGDLDSEILSKLSDIKNFKELMDFLRNKDFTSMRKWVANNTDNDPTTIYRKIYDNLYTYLEPQSIPQAVIIIAKYMYQHSFVSDPEINLVACLTEVLVDCQFKE